MISKVALEKRACIIELEVMPDHVHILAEIDPQYGANKLIKILKGRSSKLLRDVFPELRNMPSLWTNSYFISTVGGAPLQVIKQYIQNQKYV